MLQQLHDKAKSFLSTALLVLLVISFGIWGIGDIFRGGTGQDWVVKVGDTKLNTLLVARNFDGEYQQMRALLGPEFTKQKARDMGLLDRAIDKLVAATTLDLETERLGYAIPKTEIIKTLEATPQLRNADGTFNKDMFNRILQSQGMNETMFIKSQQQIAAHNMIVRGLSAAVTTPNVLINDIAAAYAQKRVAEIILVNPKNISVEATEDDATLKTYYEENKESYKAAETRNFDVLTITLDDAARDVHVNESDARKAFDEAKAAGQTQNFQEFFEQYKKDQASEHMVQIANKVDDMLAANKPLAEIASAYGLAVAAFNALDKTGADAKIEIPFKDEVLKAAFQYNEGETSPLLESKEGGYAVLRINKVMPTHVLEYDVVKSSVKKDWVLHEKAKKAKAIAETISKELKDGKSFASISGEGVSKKTSSPLMVDNKEQKDVPREALAPLFDMKKGDVAVVTTEDGQLIIRVKDVIAGSADDIETRKKSLISRLEQEAVSAHLDAYSIALRDMYPVEKDKAGLDRLISSGDGG